jgi:MFS family permease
MSSPTDSPTTRLHLGLAAIFASTFVSLTSLFLFFPLLLFTLKERGWSDFEVGLVASAEWLGLALGTPFVARWVKRLGLRQAFIVSGLLPFASFIGITLTPWPALWAVLILLGGMAGSMRWIVAEASVTQLAPDDQRGRIVGLFQTMISMTYIVGPGLLAWLGTSGSDAVLARWIAIALAGAGLVFALGVPTVATAAPDGLTDAPRLGLNGILDALRAAPVLMVAGALGGFFEAGGSGVLPLYGLALGMSAEKSALLLSACGLGGVLFMAPVGLLADRMPHPPLYRASTAVLVLASAAMPLVSFWQPGAFVIAFLWGGMGGVLYTLAMVDIGHRSQGVALVNFTAVLVLSYTLGGVLAPLLGGAALSLAPLWGLPLVLSAAAALGWLAFVMQRGDP